MQLQGQGIAQVRQRLAILLLVFSAVLTARAQINTDRIIQMGRTAIYYEDYVLAIQRFNLVIGSKNWLPEPFFYRGLAKFYLEDYKGAERDCSEAISRNAYKFDYYYLRALCRSNQDKLDDAIEDYRSAIHQNRVERNCWYNLAASLLNSKRYEDANAAIDTMLTLWPKDPAQMAMKAQVYLCLEDTTQAYEWTDRALEIDEYNGVALSLRASILLHRDSNSLAEATFSKALVQRPRESNLYMGRAIARYHQNNLRGAMDDYDQAIELDSLSYASHYNRGLLRAQVGEDNKAIEDFDFVLRLDPEDVIALYNRALLLDNVGDCQGAIRDLSAVIQEYPQFWAGYQRRAAIKRKIGDVAGAERDEFRVMKAHLDASQGKLVQDTTRHTVKKSQRHLEDHARLITEDEVPQYADLARGKVQNRHTELTLIERPKTDTPTEADLLFDQAGHYYVLGDYVTAIDSYTEALRIDDRHRESLYNRGVIYLMTDKTEEGLADLSKAGELGLYQAYNLIKRYSKQ